MPQNLPLRQAVTLHNAKREDHKRPMAQAEVKRSELHVLILKGPVRKI